MLRKLRLRLYELLFPKRNKTVLFWVPGGFTLLLNIECLVGLALRFRGYKVHFIICDGPYKVCAIKSEHRDLDEKGWLEFCKKCKIKNGDLLKKFGFDHSYIGDYLTEEDGSRIAEEVKKIDLTNYKTYVFDGVAIERNVRSSLIKFYKNGNAELFEEKILKEFCHAAMIVTRASTKAIEIFQPYRVYMSHGVYTDWGPALVSSVNNGIPVMTYVSCYLPSHFFFRTITSANDVTAQSISDVTWEKYKSRLLSKSEEERLERYIDDRYKKFINSDMKNLLKEYRGNLDEFYEKYQLDRSKPIWGIMTHITWDNVCDYFPMIHQNFDEWLSTTVSEIINIPDVQWLIKIHPSEKVDNPTTGAQAMMEKLFSNLPNHVKVISMDDDISSLNFFNLIDGGITVFGTSGLELLLMGKPVILAGSAHYGNKGFTQDAKDDANYKQLLRNAGLIKPLSDEQIALARKYAYCFFIERQIPLTPILTDGWEIDEKRIHELLPKKNKFVEFICDRIADEGEFIMDEELISLKEAMFNTRQIR